MAKYDRDKETGVFTPGSGGRTPGSRNRLTGDFLQALADDFAEFGAGAIRIVRAERPDRYLQIVAGILPKELALTNSGLEEFTDAELREAVETIRQLRIDQDRERTIGAFEAETTPSGSRH